MKKILLATIAVGLATIGTNAQGFIEEFNYGSTGGNLTTVSNSGWVAHSGTGSNPVQYISTGRNVSGYTGLSGAGGAITLAHVVSTSREDVNRAVTPSVNSGSVYVSFVLNISNSGGTTGDYFMNLCDLAGSSIGSNFRSRVFVKDGSTTGTFKLGISKGSAGSSASFTSSDYNLNQDYIVVVKYSFSTVTDTCYAFIFGSAIPATEPTAAIATTDHTISDLTAVGSVCLRQGSVGTGALTVDGIRVSTSWTNAQLPVQFKSFTASKGDNGVNLKWATASESNNKGFEVQRSVNGAKYQTVGFVRGNGNSSVVKTYTFTDALNTTGNICYRLKQIDFDGASEYSKVACVNVEVEKTTGVITTPNPFNGSLHIKYNSLTEGTTNVQIIDMLGKTHQNTNMNVIKGETTLTLDTDALPLGIYFIRITNGAEVTTQRIVKK
jgi:hypothetical protein